MKIGIYVSIVFCSLFSDLAFAQMAPDSVQYSRLKPISLSVKLSGKRSIIFNSAKGPLSFKNKSGADSIITKVINSDQPLHLFYTDVLITPTGEKRETGNLLLFPGDSVLLDNNGKTLTYASGCSHYMDSFVSPFNEGEGRSAVQMLDSIGLQSVLINTRNRYLANETKLSKFSMPPAQRQCLESFNYLSAVKEICSIPFDKISSAERSLLDSTYERIVSRSNRLALVNSPFLSIIYHNIIAYSAFKHGFYTANFWSYFDKTDSAVQACFFYQPYLIERIRNTYKNAPEQLDAMVQDLKKAALSSRFADTLFHIANILLGTRTDYTSSKKELEQFAGGKYASLLEEEDIFHRQQRNIGSLEIVNLLDFNHRKISLQSLLASGNADIIVLDFWASWCIPCIADFPFLNQAKLALENSSIRFISISIDNEGDIDKWISRAKQLNNYNQPDQYRLENPKESPLNLYFNLSSIPRYIVIDRKGNIVNEDFDRPNETGFQRKLQLYLKANGE